MAKIFRDVIIKPPITERTDIIIKGKRGGELRFSLMKQAFINPVHSRNKKQPLLVNCYRTKNLDYIEVSNYNGNKGEIIKVRVNGDNQTYIKSIIFYIISSDKRLIEYGKLKRNNKHNSKKSFFKYKTKISHQFREIKVICCENLSYDVECLEL